jgi:phytoene dehydrogenase-like protein
MAPRMMMREDPEVSELVMQRFRDEGVAVLVNHRAKEFVIENGEKILIAEHAGKDVRIPFDAVLVAVGRAANLKGLRPGRTGHPDRAHRRDQRIPANQLPQHLRRRRCRRARSSSPTPPRTRPGMPRSMRCSTPSRNSRPITR